MRPVVAPPYRALAESSLHGLALLDRDARFIYVNPRGGEILGYAPEELVGRVGYEIIQPDDLPSSRTTFDALIGGPGGAMATVRCSRKDGTPLWIRLQAVNRLDDPEVHGVIVDFDDVTAHVEADRSLESSEGRFRALIEHSWDAVALVDEQGRFSYLSPAATRLTGYPIGELLGQDGFAFIHPGDVERASAHFGDLVAGRTRLVRHVHRFHHRDGEWRWHELTAVNLLGRPEVGAVVINFRDVTEERRAEEGERFLHDSARQMAMFLGDRNLAERLVRIAVPRLGDGAVLLHEGNLGRELAVTHVDPTRRNQLLRWAEKAFGAPATHPLGRAITERRVVALTGLTEAIAGTEPPLDASGEPPLRSVVAVPLQAGERLLGVLAITVTDPARSHDSRDLQLIEAFGQRVSIALENARLLREARDAQKQAERANRAKDEFLSILSHELRSPLSAALTWSHLLRGGQLDEVATGRALESLERSLRHQAHLIEDLLDISRIVSGRLRVDKTTVDVRSLVRDAANLSRPGARAKGIRLSVSAPGWPALLHGDPSRLRQVVVNLVENAVKFTPDGGRVSIRLRQRGDRVGIEVEDTGIGISKDLLPHVFERFHQAGASTDRPYGGLGIGLAISRHLVELHGGTLEARSDGPGQGATFMVSLPAERSPVSTARAAGEENASPSLPSGLEVLLVDDDEANLESTAAMLAFHGAEVTTARSMPEAVARLEARRATVVVSDIAMPGGDGFALVRRIRELAAGDSIVVIALTAIAGVADGDRIRAAGFDGYVSKPYEPSSLVGAIRERLGPAAP